MSAAERSGRAAIATRNYWASTPGREQSPRTRHSLELVLAVVVEVIPDPATRSTTVREHEHLSRLREGRHACADVHCDTADVVVVDQFDLTSVQPATDGDTERPDRLGDCVSTSNRACRPVEHGQEVVADAC